MSTLSRHHLEVIAGSPFAILTTRGHDVDRHMGWVTGRLHSTTQMFDQNFQTDTDQDQTAKNFDPGAPTTTEAPTQQHTHHCHGHYSERFA